MDLQENWERAIRETVVIRSRLGELLTFGTTPLPYIFLAASSVNIGDTVVRKGKVLAHRPLIVLPRNFPQFKGFEFEEFHVDEDSIRTLLLLRGISFPSLKYTHQISSLEVFEGSIDKAVEHFREQLERKEDVHTGLILGPEDYWQFSILAYTASLVAKSASSDIRRLLENYWKKKGRSEN